MKLKNIKEVEAFRKVIHECEGDVYLKSPEGDVLNLKSSLSEYIALGRLLGEAGDSLELFASRREDEARLIAFLNEVDQDEMKQLDEYVAEICKHKKYTKKPSPPEPDGSGGVFCEKDTVRTRIAGADTLIGPSPPHGSLLEDPRDCHGSRARKERAPGIPRGMMRGKCAHWLAMTRLFGNCTRGAGQSPQYVV